MGGYQIGRILENWNNLTPPMRGGIYRKADEKNSPSASSSDDESCDISTLPSLSSLASSTSSLDIPQHLDHNILAQRKSCLITESNDGMKSEEPFALFEDASISSSILSSKQYPNPKSYITQVVPDKIDNDVGDYPSVDAATQRNVVLKYQALHRRIQKDGFYDCQHLDYVKEFVRYTMLFVAFLVSSYYGWYVTSGAIIHRTPPA